MQTKVATFKLTVPDVRDKSKKERLQIAEHMAANVSMQLMKLFDAQEAEEAWDETIRMMHEMNVLQERKKNVR